jgi:N4-(beta-N-acetylglucosaminyl)-L-asparaginase
MANEAADPLYSTVADMDGVSDKLPPPVRGCSRRAKCGMLAAGLAVVGAAVAVGVVLGTASTAPGRAQLPVVINTWFVGATANAWSLANASFAAVDVAELGCTYCEVNQCGTTVGYGGSPDTNGETTLDALIMDGATRDMGAVGYLRRIPNAISTARRVMEYSTQSMLCGDGAAAFANMTGYQQQSLTTQGSQYQFGNWTLNNCQPNYYQHWADVNTTCGPYTPIPTPSYTPVPGAPRAWRTASAAEAEAARVSARAGARPTPRHRPNADISYTNHDTIGMCVLDAGGNMALGMSSNGANHKVAGRVGDAPIIGAGGYVDSDVGCAAATGDGDTTMRFLPAYQAVEFMRAGMDPTSACRAAVARINAYYKNYQIGLLCLDKNGNYGAASMGWTFQYAVAAPDTGGQAQLINVPSME